eukprot:scpid21377/ scgid29194/ Integrator complex subunit 3; SOSS complex subunit A; Sensor of single-strand DNA complex subunit A
MAAPAVGSRGPGAEDRGSQRSSMLSLGSIDVADEQDEVLEKCRTYVSSLLVGVSPPEVANKLGAACMEMAAHNDIMLGLLSMILVDPGSSRMGFHNLSLLNRDGWSSVVRNLEVVIMEKFSKLQEKPRSQLLWLVNEMVKTGGKGVIGCDKLVLALLRNIEGGNLDNANIWLTEQVLNLLQENRPWLDQRQTMLCSALYTYLRLIPDHSSTALTSLRVAEVNFCIDLLRNRFSDCMTLGRDLLRLLQAVARIPEFGQLWTDLLQNPQSLSPHCTDIRQVLDIRTPRRYIACRLTHDMETKLSFMLSKVSMGTQKRYQDWFHAQYLSVADRQTLIPDLVRYICCVVHPTNEILASNVIPRWAVIGWLLMSCQSNVAASNAKLALFFDWFFYNPSCPEENIMNIEPGVLVMNQSLLKHPNMTATLLDFLCRMCEEFFPPMKAVLTSSVTLAFQDCMDKGVIQNLTAMLCSENLDGELKLLVNKTFPKFTTPPATAAAGANSSASVPGDPAGVGTAGGSAGMPGGVSMPGMAQGKLEDAELVSGPRHAGNMSADSAASTPPIGIMHAPVSSGPMSGSSESATAGFVGNQMPAVAVGGDTGLMYNFSSTGGVGTGNGSNVSGSTAIPGLDEPMHSTNGLSIDDNDGDTDEDTDLGDEARFSGDEDSTEGGATENDKGVLADVVAKTPVLLVESLTPDVRAALESLSQAQEASERCKHVKAALDAYIRQATPSELTIDHTASSLAFCLQADFSNACCESDPDVEDELPSALFRHCVALSGNVSSNTVLALLTSLQQYFLSTGYRFLYHLHITNASFEEYRQYSHCFHDLDLLSCLERDLKLCQEEDPVTFYALIPCVFTVFSEVAVGSSILIYLLVSSIDSVQLHEIVCDLMMGKYQVFGYTGLLDIIQASLEWEMFEQYFVWQLLSAEGCSVRELLPLLTELDVTANAEPVTGLLVILRQKTPDTMTTAALLRCPDDPHHIAPCVLQHWAKLHPFALTSLLVDLLRGTKVNDQLVSVDAGDVTRHLLHLRTLLPDNNSVLVHPTLRQLMHESSGGNTTAAVGQDDNNFDSGNGQGSHINSPPAIVAIKRSPSDEDIQGEQKRLCPIGNF